MVVYWVVVLLPTFLALGQPRIQRGVHALILAPLFAALFLFMALRETGGDYSTYLDLFEQIQGESLQIAMQTVEPAYGLLNWVSGDLSLGIYGVNAACALIFLYCLHRVAQKEQHPLLLLALAIPYFVIVVGMGYTRQGVAAALLMLSVVLLRERHPVRAAISVVLGSMFHYSAIIGLALPLLGATRHPSRGIRIASRLLLLPALVVSVRTLFSSEIDTYWASYVESTSVSEGALLRSLVTAAAAALFFLLRREFRSLYDDYDIWRPCAFLALLLVPMSQVASTAVDRAGLYLIPFQLVTFARLPMVYDKGRHFFAVRFLVLAAYVLYFFVWLHLGNFASELWVPYRWVFSEF